MPSRKPTRSRRKTERVQLTACVLVGFLLASTLPFAPENRGTHFSETSNYAAFNPEKRGFSKPRPVFLSYIIFLFPTSYLHLFINQKIYSLLLGLGRFFSFVILCTQPVGLLRREISRHNGATYTRNSTNTEQKHTDIHASSWIRTQDPSVQAGDDSSCLRPRGHCDLNIVFTPWQGCAIAQPVSSRLPTAKAPVRAQVRSCGTCGGQSGTDAGFLRGTSVSHASYYSTDCSTLIIYHLGLVQ
jgi:hypothetical protein